MKVYNELKTQELKEYDLTKGYLKKDKIIIKTHEAQKEVKEVSHEEIIAEYSNGGKDAKIVIDTPYQPAKDAWNEYEDIQIYVLFSKQELYQQELFELENWFNDYDLQVKQYERATRLGETFDKDIKMLDNEAREKASRVKELRKLLEG